MGYHDSSNLYAFAKNDPVNLSDPTGEVVPALAYLGWVAVNTLADVAVEGAANEIGDWWNDTETDFDWNRSLTSNFAINLATGGIGGKVAKVRYLTKLRNPVVRRAVAEGIEYAADVVVTGEVNRRVYNQDAATAYGSAALGGLLGRGAGYGLVRGARYFRDNFEVRFSAPFLPTSIAGFNPGFLKIRRRVREFGAVDPAVILRGNMKQAGVRPPPFANAAHHIVAVTDDLADPARRHLASLGIDINDEANGVFLRYTERGTGANHRFIHTGAYYAEVNARILARTTADEVRAALRQVGEELQKGVFPY